MKAGFYEVDITPELGMSCTCFNDGAAEGILTPFSITASSWSDGKKLVAAAGLDVIVIQEDIVKAACRELREKHNLDLLLCGASHTHKGGPVIENWAGDEEVFRNINELPPEIRQLGMHKNLYLCPEGQCGSTELNRQYRDSLKTKIVEAVSGAIARMQEVKLINGRANVEDMGYNRRQKMKNGFTVTHGGKGNPDIVNFAGPVDKEVVVLAAINKNDEIIGAIVNYACHATVESSNNFSADWPYFMRKTVKKMIGKETVTVFLNGCCGDVTQLNNMNAEPRRFSGKWPEILGQRVGFAAVDAIAAGTPEEFEKIAINTESLTLTYREPGKKNYESAVREANTPPDNSYRRWWAMGVMILNTQRKMYPEINCELNLLQLGNMLIVTLPTETFARTGLDIKAASTLPYTMVSELTNNWLGYLPTSEVFGPHGGGYEGKFKFGSFLEKDAEQKIRGKIIEMFSGFSPEKELKKEEITNGKPWQAWKPDEL